MKSHGGGSRIEKPVARRIGKNPAEERKEEAKLRGLPASFLQTDSKIELLPRKKCVYPVTQIPLCACAPFLDVRVCGEDKACDLAHSGYNWSPLVPGYMTMQC